MEFPVNAGIECADGRCCESTFLIMNPYRASDALGYQRKESATRRAFGPR